MLRWTFAAVLGLAGLIAAGSVADRAAPDAVLANNYGAALAEAETSWTSLPPNIWLSRLGGSGPDTALATGDTITISTKDGRPQVIEVTARELIDGDLIGAPGIRFQLVTGRPAGPTGAQVRFLFATDQHQSTSRAVQADRML